MRVIIEAHPKMFERHTFRGHMNPTKDSHGRTIWRGKFDPLVPEVSRLLVEKGYKVEWPEGHGFAAFLSHDTIFFHSACSHTAVKQQGLFPLPVAPALPGSGRRHPLPDDR